MGTYLISTDLTCTSNISVKTYTSTEPLSLHGMTSTYTIVRSATRKKVKTLPTYLLRDVKILFQYCRTAASPEKQIPTLVAFSMRAISLRCTCSKHTALAYRRR